MVKKTSQQRVVTLIFGIGILLSLFTFIFNRATSVREVLIPYLIALGVSLAIYTNKRFRKKASGIPKGLVIPSIFQGLLFGGAFYLITLVIPGFSIGVPLLPASISTTTRAFLVLAIAPIVETILFQGAIFGFFKTIVKKENTANFLQSIVFASAHLSAYITGLYNFPTFALGFSGFLANIGAFFAAFLFAFIAGSFLKSKNKSRSNLIFVMVFHFIINLIVFVSLTAIFIGISFVLI